MIENYTRLQKGAEYLTFGLQIHYLIKVIVIQFSTLYLTYIFAYPLSIPVADKLTFQIGYSLLTIICLFIVVLFIRDLCLRNFDPKFHNRIHIAASVSSYLLVSVLTVLFGFLMLIALSSETSNLSTADWVLGGFFTVACSTLLAVGYHERLESINHPKRSEIKQVVEEWNKTMQWAELADGSLQKKQHRDDFERQSEQLCDLLSNAKTVKGKQLASAYEEWWEDFQQHEALGKEIIINGQSDERTQNSELQAEHSRLMRIQRQIKEIAHIQT